MEEGKVFKIPVSMIVFLQECASQGYGPVCDEVPAETPAVAGVFGVMVYD
jgi:hypothetical protein